MFKTTSTVPEVTTVTEAEANQEREMVLKTVLTETLTVVLPTETMRVHLER